MNFRKLPSLFVFLLFCLISNSVSALTFTYGSGPSLNVQRHLHSGQKLNDGKVIIFGGYDGYLGSPTYYKSSEIFDPATNSWIAGPDMKNWRYSLLSELLPDGRVIAFSGMSNDLALVTEIYDPISNSWSDGPSTNKVHYLGASVSLPNGKILLAGGVDVATETEIYDPSINEWITGPEMKYSHGEGMTLTLLQSGKVLAVGGKSAPREMEVYDPQTNSWSETAGDEGSNRYNHAAILLSNGKVLIAGGSDGSRYTRLFDETTGTMTGGSALMPESFSHGELVLLDNGNAMCFDVGDLLSVNRNAFQEYDAMANSWSGSNNTEIGVSGYTIHRLNDGRFVIAGGNWTTGNGGSSAVGFINQVGYESCVEPNLNLFATGSSNCWGKSQQINIASSESGAVYSLWSGGRKTSLSAVGNGGSLVLPVQNKYLVVGNNYFQIGVQKTACVEKIASPSVSINAAISNNNKPTVSIVSGRTFLCAGDSIVLSSNEANSIWSSTEQGSSIVVKNSTVVTANSVDGDGCYSLPSDPLEVRSTRLSDIELGNDTTVCFGSPVFKLNAFPEGGVWSGLGVSGDTIDPSVGYASTRTLSYEYCGLTQTKRVIVQSQNRVYFDPSDMRMTPDSSVNRCGGEERSVYFNNVNENERYEVWFNDSVLYSTLGGSYYGLSHRFYPDSSGIVKVLVMSAKTSYYCPYDTMSFTYNTEALKKPNTEIQVLFPDTFCASQKVEIMIPHPQQNVFYLFDGDGTQNMGTDTIKYVKQLYSGVQSFKIEVMNSSSCYLEHVVIDSTIFAKNLEVDFTFPRIVNRGEKVNLINTSNAKSYQWIIDGTSFLTDTAPVFSYSQVGEIKQSLIGFIAGTCSDTISQSTFVVDKPNVLVNDLCRWDTLGFDIDRLELAKIHVDDFGNQIVFGSTYAAWGGASYSGSYAWVMAKFDPDGNLMWVNRQDTSTYANSSDFYSAIINDVATDEKGDIYFSGSYAAKYIYIGGHRLYQNDSYIYNSPLIGKICATTGKILWFYIDHEDNSSTSGGIRGGTDVLYKDGKVYYSVLGCKQMMDPNGVSLGLTKFQFSETGIIGLDSSGTLIEEYILGNNSYYLQQYQTPNSAATITRRVHLTAPTMQWMDNGNISVWGTTRGGDIGGTNVNKNNYPSSARLNYHIILKMGSGYWTTPEIFYGGNENNNNAHLNTYGKNLNFYHVSKLRYGYGEEEMSGSQTIDLARFDYWEYGSILRALSWTGYELWNKELVNFEAASIDYDETNDWIVVSGKHLGVVTGNSGIKKGESYNVAVLVFDAATGDVIGGENFESLNSISAQDGYLSSCGNYHLVGRNEIFSDTATFTTFRGDSLKIPDAKSFVIKLPITSVSCQENCVLITSEGNFDQNEIKIWPNPTSGEFNVGGLSQGVGSVEIRSIDSKLVKEFVFIGKNQIQISLDVTPGLYLITIKQNGIHTTSQIVVQ